MTIGTILLVLGAFALIANLLFGWTVIFWIAARVWAATAVDHAARITAAQRPQGQQPQTSAPSNPYRAGTENAARWEAVQEALRR